MDALTVETQPPVIESNFAAIRAQLEQHLAEYDEVVTADNVKEAKARATEINKLSGEIDARRKAAVDEASAPINEFKGQAKELTTMCQDVRQRILTQVKAFEAETLKQCAALLEEMRESLYQSYGVREEFQTATTEGLAKLSWMTKAGNLTAQACSTIESLVVECHARQQAVDLRLSQLENESHRAGLHTYLTREHVEGILFAPDEQYNAGLQKLIARELERQEVTERLAREKIEREQAAEQAKAKEEEAAKTKPAPQEQPTPVADKQEPEPQKVEEAPAPADPVQPGNRRIEFYLILDVDVPSTVSDEAVQAQLLERLKKAGIDKSVRSIKAHSSSQEAA